MRYPYCDMHCDTLMRTLRENPDSLYDGKGMQNLVMMREIGQMMQFFAVFFPPRPKTEEERARMAARGMKEMPDDETYYALLRDALFAQVEKHSDFMALARTATELEANFAAGKQTAMLTIEDGRIVNGSMDRLRALADDGVVAIALTWNGINCFGYPNSRDPEAMKLGLTPFGKEAIGEMERLHIIPDVSHLSDGGFYDLAGIAKKPFIASHSNCRAITDHPRNLTDEMIRVLAEHGGVAGLNFEKSFVAPTGTDPATTVDYLVAHVMHLLQVGGEDIIAMGTDFDGIGPGMEIENTSEMGKLFEGLMKAGLTERQLDKFMSGNVLRVLHETLG